MNDERLNEIKRTLDEELVGVRAMMGILFAEDVFQEFRNRDWITLENFNLGSFGFHDPMPAYDKTHFASATWGLNGQPYRIGTDA